MMLLQNKIVDCKPMLYGPLRAQDSAFYVTTLVCTVCGAFSYEKSIVS